MRFLPLLAVMMGLAASTARFVIAGEIHDAVLAHDTDRVARILKSNPDAVREPDLSENTPLHYAVRYADVTKLLLQHGANPNARDKNGSTPLSWTPTLESATLLLDAGASLKVKSASGGTPLHSAVGGDDSFDVASLLLRRGANVEYRDDNGRTPLAAAVACGSDRILTLLLNNHSDIESRDNEGRTPLFLAATRSWPPNRLDTLKVLGDHGAKVNVRNSSGDTLLHYACSLGYPDSVKWLLDHGAEVNATNARGQTPLAMCEGFKKMEFLRNDYDRLDAVIQLLRDRGASR